MLSRRHLLALAGFSAPGLATAAPTLEPPALPGSHLTDAPGGDIKAAWLFGQTGRYTHFVLGARFEASGLAVRDRSGKVHRFTLPEEAVFEDRIARLADLDGDGRTEVVVVVSTHTGGASLAMFGLTEGGLTLKAQTPPIGQPNRWLNPSGFGRFLDKDRLDVALVRTPHLSGLLEIWRLDGHQLTRRASLPGYATHRIGSRHQTLFAVLPSTSGRDRLALPTLDRAAVALIDFAQEPQEVARLPLNGRADGPFKASRTPQGWRITIPLQEGGEDEITLPA